MKKIHFIGMGGIGMSALARLLIERGVQVSGSDAGESALLKTIERLGGRIQLGHRAGNINHPDAVVYSSSIAPGNPELVAARNRGIPVLHRGQMLARLVENRRTIAVAGSHGKSTTTAMIAQLLTQAGCDPMLALGAEVEALGGNARAGRGPCAVVEADESDNSFLWLRPWAAVITNIDDEHLDYFRDRWEIEEAYETFARRVHPEGALIGCIDDGRVRSLFSRAQPQRISYGLAGDARFRAADVQLKPGWSRFRCLRDGRTLGKIRLSVPGVHNVVNSLAAVAAGDLLGLDFALTARVLESYQGARRRFQIHADVGGVLVVEDYGHHPAEIEATLAAAQGWKGRRIRCVFQPHRYSRTHHLLDRFRGCFAAADELILLPVYAASEEPLEGATSTALAAIVRQPARKKVRLQTPQEALDYLQGTRASGDLVLFLGAGSVGSMAQQFARTLTVRPEPVEGRGP